jgi:hypothetical protein
LKTHDEHGSSKTWFFVLMLTKGLIPAW